MWEYVCECIDHFISLFPTLPHASPPWVIAIHAAPLHFMAFHPTPPLFIVFNMVLNELCRFLSTESLHKTRFSPSPSLHQIVTCTVFHCEPMMIVVVRCLSWRCITTYHFIEHGLVSWRDLCPRLRPINPSIEENFSYATLADSWGSESQVWCRYVAGVATHSDSGVSSVPVLQMHGQVQWSCILGIRFGDWAEPSWLRSGRAAMLTWGCVC
jgi:hypothetical protein